MRKTWHESQKFNIEVEVEGMCVDFRINSKFPLLCTEHVMYISVSQGWSMEPRTAFQCI